MVGSVWPPLPYISECAINVEGAIYNVVVSDGFRFLGLYLHDVGGVWFVGTKRSAYVVIVAVGDDVAKREFVVVRNSIDGKCLCDGSQFLSVKSFKVFLVQVVVLFVIAWLFFEVLYI